MTLVYVESSASMSTMPPYVQHLRVLYRTLRHYINTVLLLFSVLNRRLINYCATGGQSKARNVKVIPNEECVPKHKLLVMDMWFDTTKRWLKKFEPRVCVWKLKEKGHVKNTKAWSKIRQRK